MTLSRPLSTAILAFCTALPFAIPAQIITTVAGSGVGDGLAATSACLTFPTGIAMDSLGNFYVADTNAHRVRKVASDGVISTVAGNGQSGFGGDSGAATAASLYFPAGTAVDGAGNLYIADQRNHRIRKVAPNGVITSVAGAGYGGYLGDGGAAINAVLNNPAGIAVDSSGNLYIADMNNNRVRKIAINGVISTLAGTGAFGFAGDGGAATAANLANPNSVAVDSAGNVYIVDQSNHRIRKVDSGGLITTVAGSTFGFGGDGGAATSASLANPNNIAVDSAGNLYIVDLGNQRIRKVDGGGIITTVAGTGFSGFLGDGGAATSARLDNPAGIAADNAGNFYIGDSANQRIRKVTAGGVIATVAGTGSANFCGDGGPATNARLSIPTDVAVDAAGSLYVVDSLNNRIRKVTAGGVITTLAGTSGGAIPGDGGPATGATLDRPTGITVDNAGNTYFAETNSHRIRKVTPGGTISTIAGSGFSGFSGDGGPAASSNLSYPHDVAVDGAGSLYIADQSNHRIRKVTTGGVITTVAGNGTVGFSGDGGPATSASLSTPRSVAVDGAGNLYFASNLRIRKVTAGGVITTVAGNGSFGFSGDGGAAVNATFGNINSVEVDSSGNIYIADSLHTIRKVDTAGIIRTIAGNVSDGFSGDGGPALGAQLSAPAGMAFDATGNLHIADQTNNRIRKVSVTAPGTPVIGTAVAGNGQITVPFNPAGSGFGILDFTATCGTLSATGMVSPIVVTGLANGTSYTCTVRARNALGTSAASSASNTVTPIAPSVTVLSGPATSIYGNNPQFVATVTGSSPTGSINFKNGGTVVSGCGTVPLTAGSAQCIPALPVGTYSLTAEYAGNSANLPSVSAVLAHTVNPFNTLIVTKSGTGSGTVSSVPAGINCGSDCTKVYVTGTSITLTAAAASGSAFAGWSGVACNGGNTGTTCTFTFGATTSINAAFARHDPALPDFNADGKPDFLMRNTATGNLYVWHMNGTSLISDRLVTTVDPSWKMDGIADFNGDGHPDIVWRNGAGNTYVWYLVNGVFQSDAFLFSLPPEWVIQGVADFNADGKPDFLMRNVNSGNAFAWFFNNNVAIGDQFLFNIDPSWKVEGVADLNADNQPDLLFRNVNSGLAFAWNTQFTASTLSLAASSPSIFSIDPAWEVVQVADWNADGKPDLLFRNKDSGVVFVWYLDGVSLTTSDFIVQIDPSWEIVPRRLNPPGPPPAPTGCVVKDKSVLFPSWVSGNAYNTANSPLNYQAAGQTWAFKFAVSDLFILGPNAVSAVQMYETGPPMVTVSLTTAPCEFSDAPAPILCQRSSNSGSFGMSFVISTHPASNSVVAGAGYCRAPAIPPGQDFLYVNVRYAGPPNIVSPPASTCTLASCSYYMLYQRLQ